MQCQSYIYWPGSHTAQPLHVQATLVLNGGSSFTVANSLPLVNYLGPAGLACLQGNNSQGCNAVANLCAMTLYK